MGGVRIFTGRQEPFKGETGKDPDVFFRHGPADTLKETVYIRLIAGFHGFTAQEGKTLDIGEGKTGQNFLKRFLRKGGAVLEIPGFRLETALAAVRAARDKKADADSLAVRDVIFFYVAKIHHASSLNV